MNILWLISSNTQSANSKIAINLARRMKDKHHVQCAIYAGMNGVSYPELNEVFEKNTTLCGYNSLGTGDLSKNASWLNKTKIQKILFLLSNPRYLVAKINKKYAESSKKCAAQIERICRDEHIDIVIAIVFPDEYIEILPMLNVDSKLMAVQLDPYVSNALSSSTSKELKVKLEKKFLEKLDALFTTGLIKKEIICSNPNIGTPIIEIEFPEIDEISKKDKEHHSIIRKSDDEVILVYAGSLYKDIRNPKYLVHLMEELPENYKLAIAGINTNVLKEYDEKIRHRVIDLGLISQEEVRSLVNDADVLICFNNAVSNQVPSKLIECIETGKPFINLCQLENCPTLPYVKNYDNALTVYTFDIKGDELIRFISTRKGKVVSREDILKRYYKHTVGFVENQIEEEMIQYVSI